MSRLALLTSGDPRRPNEECEYKPAVIDPDKQMPDIALLCASILGMAGLYLRMKWCIWLCVFMSISSFMTTRNDQLDMKQLAMSGSMALMGILTFYVVKLPPRV